jgi:hypothetical protein
LWGNRGGERDQDFGQASPQVEEIYPRITRINTNYVASYRWLEFSTDGGCTGARCSAAVWSLATATEVAGGCQTAAIKRSLMFNPSTDEHGCSRILWGNRGGERDQDFGQASPQVEEIYPRITRINTNYAAS